MPHVKAQVGELGAWAPATSGEESVRNIHPLQAEKPVRLCVFLIKRKQTLLHAKQVIGPRCALIPLAVDM